MQIVYRLPKPFSFVASGCLSLQGMHIMLVASADVMKQPCGRRPFTFQEAHCSGVGFYSVHTFANALKQFHISMLQPMNLRLHTTVTADSHWVRCKGNLYKIH